MRIDAEKGEGVDLAKQYSVRGYPTTVFVNSDGEEVDRVVGYLPIDEFLAELKRIEKGENTYGALQEQVNENPRDIDALKAFASKIEQRNQQSQEALALWKKVADIAETGSADQRQAEYKIAEYEAVTNQNPEPLLAYTERYPDSDNSLQAMIQVMQIYRRSGETEKEAEVFRDVVNRAVEQGNTDVNMLNSYAWRMAELDMNLEDALDKITMAVAKLDDASAEQKAQVKDTHAEVLWKLGKTDKALAVINECIALQPDDSYYKEQKAKYQSSTG